MISTIYLDAQRHENGHWFFTFRSFLNAEDCSKYNISYTIYRPKSYQSLLELFLERDFSSRFKGEPAYNKIDYREKTLLLNISMSN